MIIGPSYIGLKGWPVRGPCGPIMIEIGRYECIYEPWKEPKYS